ncbi:hypothetical protein C7M84_010035 [Penaeus vannamei]|uniref:Uncharacterized protein n=1 Tax=Penaeus vannamei TaxID=6689 RepID=A0A3R7PMV9_PENVA|nr:hypothetical protein C7M84_010035 [Penaeus vannamei]
MACRSPGVSSILLYLLHLLAFFPSRLLLLLPPPLPFLSLFPLSSLPSLSLSSSSVLIPEDVISRTRRGWRASDVELSWSRLACSPECEGRFCTARLGKRCHAFEQKVNEMGCHDGKAGDPRLFVRRWSSAAGGCGAVLMTDLLALASATHTLTQTRFPDPPGKDDQISSNKTSCRVLQRLICTSGPRVSCMTTMTCYSCCHANFLGRCCSLPAALRETQANAGEQRPVGAPPSLDLTSRNHRWVRHASAGPADGASAPGSKELPSYGPKLGPRGASFGVLRPSRRRPGEPPPSARAVGAPLRDARAADAAADPPNEVAPPSHRVRAGLPRPPGQTINQAPCKDSSARRRPPRFPIETRRPSAGAASPRTPQEPRDPTEPRGTPEDSAGDSRTPSLWAYTRARAPLYAALRHERLGGGAEEIMPAVKDEEGTLLAAKAALIDIPW